MESKVSETPNFSMEEHIGCNFFITQHFHKVYEIYALEKGEVEYFIKDTVYTVHEGDIVIIPPNTLHKTVSPQHHKRRRILLYLDMEYLQEFDRKEFDFLDAVSVYTPEGRSRARSTLSALWKEYQNAESETLLKAMLCEFLLLLKKERETKLEVLEKHTASGAISNIITYMNENFNSDLTLTQVANHFYMHSTYLSRLFKENTGLTFSEYIRKFRIQKSLEKLENSRENITEIAFSVGFNSTNHFCKTFKAIMGTSPLKYRKQFSKHDA